MPITASLNDVMRVRRHQPTRLEGFVDASFAFAVTLVVISIGHVPNSVDDMLNALRGLPAFAACFLMIARIWLSHRDWSRHYDIEDSVGMMLSLILVFIVLIYVYPLRLLYALMFDSLSSGLLNDGIVTKVETAEQLSAGYIVFGLGLAAISLVFFLLFRHALTQSERIGLSVREILYTRMKMSKWWTQLLLCLGSILFAYWLPNYMAALAQQPTSLQSLAFSIPGLIYLLNIVTGRRARRRYWRALADLTPGDA